MNNQEQWHMKKEINLAHVITTVALVVSGFWYFGDLDKRIASNKQEIKHVKMLRQEDQARIEKQLDSINLKLDKLLEK